MWEYKTLIIAADPGKLIDVSKAFDVAVSEYLNDGWAPIGGVSVCRSELQWVMTQAVIRKKT